MSEPVWDVVVVGAGPAGSMAAHTAATAGARTLLLDRATHPRYKTCGGGVIGSSLAALPAGFTVPERDAVSRVSFTVDGRRERTRHSPTPVLGMVDRAELDAGLAREAARAGAELRMGVAVRGVSAAGELVELATTRGTIVARTVIGADGSNSRVGTHVGVRLAQVDLGLEVELASDSMTAWHGRVHLDWGSLPGSYAWVFPKGDRLTVGVIAAKGNPRETRAYLDRFTAERGLAGARELHRSGHLTRCREPASPLRRGRVLVCGDAAGLLEPWTREGISFALRSGHLAGAAAASELNGYETAVAQTLGPEMAAGTLLHTALARHPRLVHAGIAGTGPGWSAFIRVARGEASLAGALAHRPVRLALQALRALPTRK